MLKLHLSSHVERPEVFHLDVGGVQNHKREAALLYCLCESLQQATPIGICQNTIQVRACKLMAEAELLLLLEAVILRGENLHRSFIL